MKRSCKGQRGLSLKNKYLSLTISLLLFFIGARAQSITYTPMTAGGYQFKYMKADSGLALPFFDTSLGRGTGRPGPVIISTRDSLPYFYNGIKWILFGTNSGGGGSSTGIDSIYITGNNLWYYKGGTQYGVQINKMDSIHVSGDSVYTCIADNCTFSYLTGPDSVKVGYGLGVSGKIGNQTLFALHPDGLVSGGIVTGGGGLNVDITAAQYFKNFNLYATPQTTLTDVAADGTHDRTDAVIVDTSGNIFIRQGTPAVNPIDPYHNPVSELVLSYFKVPAGATELVISDGIYHEGTEWDTAHAGTIAVAWQNTDKPHTGSNAIFVSAYGDSSQLKFTKPSGTDTIINSSSLKSWFYFNGRFSNSLLGQWYNGSTAVSNVVDLTPYLNRNDSNEYQNGSFPQYLWNFSSPVVNKIVFTLRGSDLSGAKGFYLDDVELQSGINNPYSDFSYKADSAGTYKINDTTYISGTWTKGVFKIVGDTIHIRASGGSGGSGVTNVSSADDNATVANPTTTPVITIVAAPKLQTARNIQGVSFDGTAAINPINGTGFVKATGTTISYDNSSYLTTVDTTNISNFSVKVRSLFNATSPITYSNGLIGITQATTSTNGYLSSTDWNHFNLKVDSLTKNAGGDSFYVWTNGSHIALLDRGTASVTQTYTSGSTATANNTTTWLIINPATIQSALTITLAASPTDGQKIEISFGGTITSGNGVVTALTLSPNSGQTLKQSSTPDYMQSGDAISYRYNSSNTSWYRIN